MNDQQIRELAEKHGFMDVKIVGGRRSRFTCNHGSDCRKKDCDCVCHGDTDRHIETWVKPEFSAAIREAIAITRKATIEECLDEMGKGHYRYAARRIRALAVRS